MVSDSTPRQTARFALPLHPGWLAVILLGGMAGTATRAALEAAFPSSPGGVPWATFGINVTGAFMLGALLEFLLLSGPDHGWRRAARLGLGTGALGGYTTYSTFAVETMNLLGAGHWLRGVGYALGSVILGFAAAVAGLATVHGLTRGKERTA